jgi:predicted transglutaminase-like cysteine proteinase
MKREFTNAEQKQLFIEAKLLLDNGHLQEIIDMVIAESEHRQLYQCSNQPVRVTDAQLEAERRNGIGELMKKVNQFANKAIKESEKEFDKYESI